MRPWIQNEVWGDVFMGRILIYFEALHELKQDGDTMMKMGGGSRS
jgi:hypothetical protein